MTRLTREPILGATSSDTTFDTSLRSYTSPVRSGTVSPTASSIKTNGNGRASSNSKYFYSIAKELYGMIIS